jgi:sodium transport system permease protein
VSPLAAATWRPILVVFAKEVLDNVRDRRSLLVALIYPLLGPILLGLMISMVTKVTVAGRDAGIGLIVQGGERAPGLIAYLEGRGVHVRATKNDPFDAVSRGEVEAALVISEDFSADFQAQRTASIKIIANSSRLPGLIALNLMAGLLGDYNQRVWGKRIAERGVDFRKLQPLAIENINVTSGAHITDIFLFMVPPLFIFNLFMGGVYLALDTTSGERERGSLEPLLINPVERWGLMLGKFLAALLFTAVTVTVQLIAFSVIFDWVGGAGFAQSLDAPVVLGIILLSLPLMMVAVGVQFIIAISTHSFKEAQTYLGLIPLVPAIPGMVLVFAPVRTHDWMMAVPVFSQTLLLGRIMRDEAVSAVNVLVSMGFTTAAALVLLALAARLYEREKLIFGG